MVAANGGGEWWLRMALAVMAVVVMLAGNKT
jgi:hypothetical protein